MVMHSTNLLVATHLHGHFASQISHLFSKRDFVASNLWQLIDNNDFINECSMYIIFSCDCRTDNKKHIQF